MSKLIGLCYLQLNYYKMISLWGDLQKYFYRSIFYTPLLFGKNFLIFIKEKSILNKRLVHVIYGCISPVSKHQNSEIVATVKLQTFHIHNSLLGLIILSQSFIEF